MVELRSVLNDRLADGLEVLNLLISELCQQLSKTLIEVFLLVALMAPVGAKLHEDLII